MMLTEKEASRRWCPFVRMDNELATYNRLDDGSHAQTCYCLGSGCMAWRWATFEEFEDEDEGRGFCGLASRPLLMARRP